jgi:hypothetical protein
VITTIFAIMKLQPKSAAKTLDQLMMRDITIFDDKTLYKMQQFPYSFTTIKKLDEQYDKDFKDKMVEQLLVEKESVNHEPIILRVFGCKLPLIPGTEKSIEFHRILADLGVSEIFESETIKVILKYKMEKI